MATNLTADNDNYRLTQFNEEVFGLAGNDTIDARYDGNTGKLADMGAVILHGGEGNDILYGGPGVTGQGGSATLYGDDGNDTLIGGEGADTLNGGDGDDTLEGHTARIVLSTQTPSDVLDGGIGTNTMVLNYLNFYFDKGGGITPPQPDPTKPMAVTVDISTGSGQVTVVGGFKAEQFKNIQILNFNGSEGDDVVKGGGLDDTIQTNGGNDTIDAGAGNDTIIDNYDVIKIDGGDGNDSLSLKASANIFSLSAATVAIVVDASSGSGHLMLGGSDYGTFTSIEHFDFSGAQGNDVITGETDTFSAKDSFLSGGDGNDVIVSGDSATQLNGGTGDDTLTGGAGNDTLTGGTGKDAIDGRGGNDTFYVDIATDLVAGEKYDGGSGDDTLLLNASNPTISTIDLSKITIQNIEHVRAIGIFQQPYTFVMTTATLSGFKSFTDESHAAITIDLTDNASISIIGQYGIQTLQLADGGQSVDDTVASPQNVFRILGGSGADDIKINGTASGGGGADKISGSGTFSGDAGNDVLAVTGNSTTASTLNGGADNDTLTGGAGNDTIDGGAGADQLDGGGGSNTLSYSDDTTGVSVDLSKSTASGGDAAGDTVVFASFANLIGGAGNDVLTGDNNSNVVNGGGGANTLNGLGGNDTLTGGAGNDTIAGGAGSDTLNGGGGNDTYVYDGQGVDSIVGGFSAGKNGDVIKVTSTYSSFAQLQAHTSVVGNNTLIDFGGGNALKLTNFTTALTTDNFVFTATPTKAPTVTSKLLTDSGFSATDNITDIATLTGGGDKGAVVHFTVDGTPIGDTATANATTGVWTFTPTGLSDGKHTIVASETNAGGVSSSSLTFTLDTTAPKLMDFAVIGSAITNATSVVYDIKFSEPVTGVAASAFSLLQSNGMTGAKVTTVAAVAGSNNAEYHVTVSTGTHDGTLDLILNGAIVHDVAGNQLSNAGVFQAPHTVGDEAGNGGQILAVAAGDINGDGQADILTANTVYGSLSILLGDGHGGFTTDSNTISVNAPTRIALADLNNDGHLDIVTGGGGTAAIVALGSANGTFAVSNVALGLGSDIRGIVLADVDGNKSPDIIALDNSMGISVSTNNGDGTFATAITQSDGGIMNARGFVVGDFNGDNKADLAILDYGNRQVAVMFGNGDHTFQAPVTYSTDATSLIATGDFNGDGKADIVTLGGFGTTILINNGSGGFTSFAVPSFDFNPNGLAVVDVNGDGNADIVGTNGDDSSNLIGVLFGNGDGTFKSEVTFNAGFGTPSPIASSDFDGDGIADLVIGQGTGGGATVLLNNSTKVSGGSITVDKTGPVLFVDLSQDAGPSSTDNVSNVSRIIVTTDIGVTPSTFTVDGNAYTLTDFGDGSFGFDPNDLIDPHPLADGMHTVVVTASDAAHNSKTVTYKFTQDTVAPTLSTAAASANKVTTRSAISLTLNFSEAVYVDQNKLPVLAMTSGGGTATYVSGSGTTALKFSYTPAAADTTNTSFHISGVTNGARIFDTAGNNATIGNTAFTGGDVTISQIPVVTAAQSTGDQAYKAGEHVTIAIDFNEVVNVDTAAGKMPSLKLSDGAAAAYLAGSGSNELTFGYVVGAHDNSASLKIASVANGASITGAGNTAAILSNAGSFNLGVVDSIAPNTTVKLLHDNGASAADKLTNDPTLTGGGEAYATVTITEGASVVGTTMADSKGAWTFTPTGLSDGAHTLTATENDAAGNVGNPANVSLKLDATTPAPGAGDVSSSPASGAHIGLGGSATITINLGEAISVAGAPTLVLSDGEVATYSAAASHLTTGLIAFTYTAAANHNTGDLKIDHVALPPGASVKDLAGNVADFSAIASTDLGFAIDTIAPKIQSIAINPNIAGETLLLGQTVELDLTASEALVLGGSSTAFALKLSDGGVATFDASHSDLSNGLMAFEYKVGVGQNTTGAATLKTTGLMLPTGSSIKDAFGNALVVAGAADPLVGDLHVHVDSNAPTVTGITATPVTPGAKSLTTGDHLTIKLTLKDMTTGDNLIVTGSPSLQLNDGATATLTGHTATSLTFDYLVGPEGTHDLKVTGINFDNGDFITDNAGNPVVLPASLATTDLKLPVNLYTWTTAQDGLWFDSSKWSPHSYPGNQSAAVIAATGKAYTVTVYGQPVYSPALGSYVPTTKIDDLTVGGGVTLNVAPTVTNVTQAFHVGFDINNSGTIDIAGGNSFDVGTGGGPTSSITNKGTINLHSADLVIGNAVTLTGGGTVNLDFAHGEPGITDRTLEFASSGDVSLTNVDNKIIGAAQTFGPANGSPHKFNLINGAKGLIEANAAHVAITIGATSIQNAGTLESVNTGGLILQGDTFNSGLIEAISTGATGAFAKLDQITVTNTAKGVILASGAFADVQINGATVIGGTLKTTGGSGATAAAIDVIDSTLDGSGTLNPINIAGLINLSGSSTLKGVVNNTGTMNFWTSAHVSGSTINNAAAGVLNFSAGAGLIIGDSLSFMGTGKINLTANTASIISDGTHDAHLTNVGNIITGSGKIGDAHLTIDNQAKGVIDATSANALTISAASFSNEGTLEAQGASHLVIDHTTMTQSAAASIRTLAAGAVTGAHIDLDAASISGGLINTVKGSFIDTLNNDASFIIGAKITNAGTIWASDGDLTVSGSTITNSGMVLANGGDITIDGAVSNTGMLVADGHHLTVTGAVAGLGTGMVLGTGELDLGSAATTSVAFDAAAAAAELVLHNSGNFTGKIAGFSVDDKIDLVDLNSASLQAATYSGTATGGTLTLKDGTHTSKIAFTGNYAADLFHVGDDGHGGVEITLMGRTLSGDAGDNISIATVGADTISGGGHGAAGDTVSYAASAFGVTVDLNLATKQLGNGDARGDVLTDIQNLTGSAFADHITGDANANVLTGGLGADTLTGGGGADNFQFKSVLDGGDEITDFTQGTDHILISKSGFGIAATIAIDASSAAQDFGLHYLVNGASGTPAATETGHGQFLFNEMTSQLFWDDDGKGSHAAKLVATLDSVHAALTAHDFALV